MKHNYIRGLAAVLPVFRFFVLVNCILLMGDAQGADLGNATPTIDCASEEVYPPAAKRIQSPGNTTYFVNPTGGDDRNAGTSFTKPWRTCRPINARLFGPGDRLEIYPGRFEESLMPMGSGTAENPIQIHFMAGAFDFYPSNAIKLKLHISNSNDDPNTPKAVALLFQDTRHLRVSGNRTDIFVHGKMIETMVDHAEDIAFSGLAFDYRRPMVSEFTVLNTAARHADVEVNRDSAYTIEHGELVWIGEGWRSKGMALNQEYDPSTGSVWRRGNGPLTDVTKVVEQSPFKLRLFFDKNPGLVKGRVIQFRETFRDCAGGFVNRSTNISWKNGAFHALGGMGIVSQFSENLTFDHMVFAPRPGSGRTTAGWADLLHFSGCRGKISVTNCEMSGSHDDPINVHGTHLRIVGRPSTNQVLVRFMHPQTYGIEAFVPGDEIEFVSHVSLNAYATNRVMSAAPQNEKDVLLTLEKDAPAVCAENDVIENVTWTPSVEIKNCRFSVDSCRGLLLTTRRPVLVESNTFLRTGMSAILVADDANSWFESGVVRDMIIRGNRFIQCGEPVINIAPEIGTPDLAKPVHSNIRILDNYFELRGGGGIAAKSVRGLTIAGNRFSTKTLPVKQIACSDVVIENNTLAGKTGSALGKSSEKYNTQMASPTPAKEESKEKTPDNPLLTVERIFGKDEFKTEDWGPARWLKDGSGYTTLEKSETVKEAKDIVRHDPLTGRREILVFATNLIARGEAKPLRIEDYDWADDTSKLLVFTNSKRVWRRNTRGDYWVLDMKTRELKKLGGKAAPSTLMFAAFSPDASRVAYVCQNNLFVQSLKDLRVTRLTSDGSENIVNGTSDWVYEEEFYLRDGFKWSPDGKNIAYWQFDTSEVREFPLIDNTSALYPKVTYYAYPKVGETNSSCRIGVVPARGGATRWIRAGENPANYYIPEMEWSKDSSHVVFQRLNRLQSTNQISRAEIKTGATQVLHTERDEAWVDVEHDWRWIDNGRSFLWLSERDGWRHAYAVAGASGKTTLLTPGAYDVIAVSGVDEKSGWVYFIASPDNPTQRYLFRARLDGRGEVERISPSGQPGVHSYDISKDYRWAFHTYSRFGQPPAIDLVELPTHKSIRVLAGNSTLRAKVSALKACSNEFFRVNVGEGLELDAWCVKPPDFDPSKKYPLLMHVYGEPAGSTVMDVWGGSTYLWHCMLAQQGYVVMSVDNRGAAAPRGRDWRKCIYRQVGVLAPADQAAATKQILSERDYLDPKRVGIWGWSGGGSMSLSALFRYPELYSTAIAIAFISNQLYYDTIYQERYMGLPHDNALGFKLGSPISFASQLKGNLLLVHGTGDDNCHYQNCEALINELIKQNKHFSLMSYPNRTHSISEGANTKRHLFETLTRYLQDKMPANR